MGDILEMFLILLALLVVNALLNPTPILLAALGIYLFLQLTNRKADEKGED